MALPAHRLLVVLLAGVLAGAAPAPGDGPGDPQDPLARELERLADFVGSTESEVPIWADVKEASAPTLERAQTALRDGRRLLALQRLAAARVNLAAAAFMLERIAADQHDEAAFEAAWGRVRDELDAKAALDLAALKPAAVRAMAESALYQAPILHLTSQEYGRATDPDIGIFYVGQARAQLEFAELCAALPREAGATDRPEPPLRDLTVDLDALESEILAAYRPPASIDRHPEFITVGSYLKESREMNGLGHRHGALLAYMHASMRFASLRPAAEAEADDAPGAESLAAALQAADARYAADAQDQSLGALFVEIGLANLAETATNPEVPPLAQAIVEDVLPRYDAALRPGNPGPARPPAEVDVTIVRWPFT